MKKSFTVFFITICVQLFISCAKNNPTSPSDTSGRISVNNNEQDLNLRVIVKNDSVTVDSVSGLRKGSQTQAFSMTLVAEISPPVVNGQSLQATSVSLSGQFGYIGYNLRGNTYAGGVDIVQLKGTKSATIRSEATFNDTKVSSVSFDNNTGNLYLAEACGNPVFGSPAVAEVMKTSGNKLSATGGVQSVLTSFVATSIAVGSGKIFATTGNTGGLYTLTTDSLKSQSFSPITDARWVDFDANYIAVVQGGGHLTVFNAVTGNLINTFTFTGTSIPESKSTVRIIGGKALIAAGDGGVKLMNLATGTIVGSIPRTIVAGLDSSLSVTNAVDGSGQYIYISNGEAGVYVAHASQALENPSGDTPIALTVLGKLQFASLQSVNHVAFDGSTLVIASGLGGVKVVNVTF
ncbi:MAG TPA: hypothetical protein VI758_07630 [Bacteroidota bacterium]